MKTVIVDNRTNKIILAYNSMEPTPTKGQTMSLNIGNNDITIRVIKIGYSNHFNNPTANILAERL
jgi:hypothetical protein